GGYLEFAPRPYVGCTGDREFLAVVAENGYRLRRPAQATKPWTNNDAGAATSGSCGSRTGRTAATSRSPRTAGSGCATTCATTTATGRGGANIHPPDVALTHRSVPGGLHFATFIASDPAVNNDVGIGNPADRAVLVMEHRGPIAPIAVIIVAPLILHRREIHRLGVDEFGALYGVVGAHAKAGIQQVGDRPGLACGVVLVIHEGNIVQFMTVIVELVGADREIRKFGLRQAASVSFFRRRLWIADVLGFAHEQRVHHARRKSGTAGIAGRMRVATGIVGQLQVLIHVHLTAAPEAAIAVFVSSEILDD